LIIGNGINLRTVVIKYRVQAFMLFCYAHKVKLVE